MYLCKTFSDLPNPNILVSAESESFFKLRIRPNPIFFLIRIRPNPDPNPNILIIEFQRLNRLCKYNTSSQIINNNCTITYLVILGKLYFQCVNK